MMRRKYSVQQINAMRIELIGIYSRAVEDLGEDNVSWRYIGEMIENEIESLSDLRWKAIIEDRKNIVSVDDIESIKDIDFQTDNFRKFVTGENKTMRPQIKLIALDIFLSETENKYSNITDKNFGAEPKIPKVARLLSDFLKENTEEKPYLKSSYLFGDFSFKSDKVNISINFYDCNEEDILSISLREKRKSPYKADSYNEFVYEGWAVISPNDSVFCILKNKTEYCNHIYITLGVDEGFMINKKVSYVAFLNQPTLHHYEFDELKLDDMCLFTSWANKNNDKVICFQRII